MLIRREWSFASILVLLISLAPTAVGRQPEGLVEIGPGRDLVPGQVGAIESPQRTGPSLADIPMRTEHPSTEFLSRLPGVGLFEATDPLAATNEEAIIRAVYDTYSRYSERDDGERVRFALDQFETYYRPDFDSVAYYPELMSLSSGWKISAQILSRQLDDGARNVRYDAEWVPGLDLEDRPDLAGLLGMPADEMLGLVAEEFPDWRRTIAITSYRVAASYLGRTETYRAGFVWKLDQENRVELSIVDAVVPELPYAALEGDPPTAEYNRESRLPFDRSVARSTTAVCEPKTWPTRTSTQQAQYNAIDHVTGRHEAVYIGKFDCTCDTSCFQSCNAGFEVQACQDYGALRASLLLHEVSKRAEVRGGTSDDGRVSVAQCASGLGCFVKSCFAQSCGGVDIKVSGGVAGLSFSSSAYTVLGASLTNSHTCAACLQVEIPPEEPSGPVIQDGGGGSLPPGTDPTGGSPILVDLDRGGFRFSDLAGGVRFDLDGDGVRERMAWIAADAGDGWLALDRDGDGAIGSGAELFGDFTPQPPAAEPHGYLALAVYDGNGDRAITAADAVFGDLRIWLDADRDGTSQPGELSPLAAWGIAAVELDYAESRRRDRHGNELRYAARVRLDDGTTQSADVFLLRE